MKKVLAVVVAVVFAAVMFVGCGAPETPASESPAASKAQQSAAPEESSAAPAAESAAPAGDETIKIGVSFGTLQEERWEAERKRMVEDAEAMPNVEIVYADANHDANTQNQQIEDMITQGVDVLVIGAQDNNAAAVGAKAAKDAGIPVISYARIINTTQQDLIVSYDYVSIGETNAKLAMEAVPKGKYMLVNGHDADSIPHDINTGYHNVLDAAIDSGDINVVFDQYIENWSPDGAMAAVENILTKENNDIQAIVCNNDGMAGGAVQALIAQKLDGKVFVAGMDCDLAACQRIVEGKQTSTVLTGYDPLADAIFNAALELAQGKTPSEINGSTDIDGVSIPCITMEPQVVNKDNIDEIVIKSGMRTVEDVYQNVPKEEWPSV